MLQGREVEGGLKKKCLRIRLVIEKRGHVGTGTITISVRGKRKDFPRLIARSSRNILEELKKLHLEKKNMVDKIKQ